MLKVRIKGLQEKHIMNKIDLHGRTGKNSMTIISLNVNGINNLIKRHTVANWLKKKKTGVNTLLPTRNTL